MTKLTPEQIRADRVKQRNITVALMITATVVGLIVVYLRVWP